MAIAGAIPTVACNLVCLANSARREHDRSCPKNLEPPTLAFVTESTHHAVAIFQQGKNRMFHVHIDTLMSAVILQRANHFQPRPITDVRQARIFVATEVSL